MNKRRAKRELEGWRGKLLVVLKSAERRPQFIVLLSTDWQPRKVYSFVNHNAPKRYPVRVQVNNELLKVVLVLLSLNKPPGCLWSVWYASPFTTQCQNKSYLHSYLHSAYLPLASFYILNVFESILTVWDIVTCYPAFKSRKILPLCGNTTDIDTINYKRKMSW